MSVYHTGACDEPTPKQEAGAAATPSRQATRSSVLAALFLPFLPAQGVEHDVGGLDAGDEHGTCRRKGVGVWLGWDKGARPDDTGSIDQLTRHGP